MLHVGAMLVGAICVFLGVIAYNIAIKDKD
jgi:hypothetical protein